MVTSKTLEEEILFNYFECYMNMTRRNEIGFVVCFEQQKIQNQMLGLCMPLFSFYSSFGVEYNSKEIWLFCVVSLIDGIRWYDLCVRSSLKIFAKVNYLRVITRVWIIQVQPNKNQPQDSPFGKRQLLPLPLLPKRKLVIRWDQDEHHPGQNLKIPMMDIQGILTGFELKANCIWMNVNDIFWSFFMGYFGPFTLDFYMLNPFCAGISISFFSILCCLLQWFNFESCSCWPQENGTAYICIYDWWSNSFWGKISSVIFS